MRYSYKLVLLASFLMCYLTTGSMAKQPTASSQTAQVTTLTLTDDKAVAEARTVAEKYWNAQKTSDGALFHSVTPHDSMNVVFGWSFVKQSAITVEEGSIAPIRDNFQQFLAFHQRYKSLPALAPGKVEAVTQSATYAKMIETDHPFLGEFFRKSYWETITPPNFANSNRYRLMRYEFIADVEFQSKAGTTLKKRVYTLLRRLIVDSYDSRWKVFFIPGS